MGLRHSPSSRRSVSVDEGASWFHEDPLNFRIASQWYAYEGWRSALTGFRCVLDGNQTPPRVPESKSDTVISVAAARKQLEAAVDGGPPTLVAGSGTSRHVSIRVPKFGAENIGLTAPETITWNGTGVMTWRKTPDMTWTQRTTGRAAYEMRFDELRVVAEFLAHDDCVEQRFTAVNLTERPGRFHTSSCFNLQSHPMFYDLEQLRTYVLDAQGKPVPMRRLSRGGDCVRWITGPRRRSWARICSGPFWLWSRATTAGSSLPAGPAKAADSPWQPTRCSLVCTPTQPSRSRPHSRPRHGNSSGFWKARWMNCRPVSARISRWIDEESIPVYRRWPTSLGSNIIVLYHFPAERMFVAI